MPIVLRPPTDAVRVSLPARLAALGRSRRWATTGAAAFALVGAAGGLAAVTGGLDAWLHLSPLARAFALVVTLTAAGVLLLGILAGLRLPTDPLAVAMELEDRFPRLNDSLASAVSFLAEHEGGGDRGVSRHLRAAAVRRAERLAERHDFSKLVPAARCWRAFVFMAGVLCVAVPLALWDSGRTATALTRLADPFGPHPWPAKTRVEILAPRPLPNRLPKGEPFELQFAVRGEIPDRATVAVRVQGGEEFEDEYPLAKADPKHPAALPADVFAAGPVAVVSARFDPGRVAQSFAFRVTANDADTGWQPVTVVPPPRLVPLDGRASPQIRVVPPAYTGLSAFELPDGAAVVEIPVGTVVSLRAAADVPLSRAVLSYQGDRSAVVRAAGLAPAGHLNPLAATGAQLLADAIGADVPVRLSGDGRRLAFTFTPSASGMYALKLTDETGLNGVRLLELRLAGDPPPAVSLVRPAAGRDPALVVPDAAIDVQVSANDRVYALRRTFLEYRVGREGPLRTFELADARQTEHALPALVGGCGAASPVRPDRFETAFPCPVAAFLRDDGTPVRDGDLIVLRAAADDWDDVSVLKEPGRSGEVEIRVASREAVEAFLQKELGGLRPDLARVREQQRDATQKADGAKPQPDGTLTPADREKLLAAEQAQRQVRGRVADARDGLRARAEGLRELARANGLPKSRTTDRVEAVADELGRLADRDLAAVEPLLGEARQKASQPSKAGEEPAVPGLLARSQRHQKAVEDGLTTTLDLLSQWGGAGEIRGDARLLRDAVRREAGVADQMPDKVTPGKAPEALPPSQQSELNRAAGRLERLSDQARQLLGRAGALAAEKDKQAADARAAADARDAEAKALQQKAAAAPANSDARRELDAKAGAKLAEAADLRATADRAAAEAVAIRKGTETAGGQAVPDDLRRAADAVRNNRTSEAATLDRAAADRLDRLAAELTEKPAAGAAEAKRQAGVWKDAADQLDELAGLQDELRKRAAEANRQSDPQRRADELRRLAAEQEKLIEQTRELAQRLAKERGDDAARDARAALDRMEAARDDLERGANPAAAQQDATTKLDDARDKLDAAAANTPREQTDERRRKLAAQVRAVLDRQRAAVAEAARVQGEVVKEKQWTRPLLADYSDLEDREAALAVEVRALADREFPELPVFARVVTAAAAGMDRAAEKAKLRRETALNADPDDKFDSDREAAADDRVRRPMDLAVRRLEQVLAALDPNGDRTAAAPPADTPQAAPQPPPPATPPPEPAAGDADVIPPLAQLKALRLLQAELNERTAAFAKAHPDPADLTDEQRDELKELEDAQREIAALFEQMAKLFQKPAAGDRPPPATPAEEKP